MRKILIASLGAGNKERKYNNTNYIIDNKIYPNEKYVASALEKHFNIDKTFYIGTLGSMWENVYNHYCNKLKKIKNDNYEEEIFYKMAEFIEEPIANKQKYPLDFINFKEFIETFDNKVIPIITSYGMNDREIFENFNNILTIMEQLEDGDKLYLDITHSFRANAFWMFLVMNYINDVTDKDIAIEYISYGMYEAKEKNIDNVEVTPIINLKVFFDLTKWIKGAYTFKNFGNSDLICELIEEENKDIKNKLKNFSDAININYVSSLKESIKSLKKNYDLMNKLDGPAKLIIPKVVSEFLEHFKGTEEAEDYEVFFKLAKWHQKEKRYSVAYTNVHEAFKSYAEFNGFYDGEGVKKLLDEFSRTLFYLEDKNNPKSKLILKDKYIRNKVFDNKTETILRDFLESYFYSRDVRNNIAHSEKYSSGKKKNVNADADIKSLEKVLNSLENIIQNKYFLKNCKEKAENY